MTEQTAHHRAPATRAARRRSARRARRRSLLVVAALSAGAVVAPVTWAAGLVGGAAPVTRVEATAPARTRDEASAVSADRAVALAHVIGRASSTSTTAPRGSAAPSAPSAAETATRAPTSSSPAPPAPSSSRPTASGVQDAGRGTSASTAATVVPTAAATSAVPAAAPAGRDGSGILAGATFWVDPDSDARQELARGGDPVLARIADAPGAVWLGDWVPTEQARARTADVVDRAAASGSVPVLVLYAVPGRDCGGYSSGGLGSASAYASWVREVAAGIGDRRAVVVVEPDALAQVDCLSGGARAERSAMLRDAVDVLAGTAAVTYLDAGNSGWVDAATMAQRLRDAGVAHARGFALNTSNSKRTADEEDYGERLSAALGGSHYVVDTSRNGNGPAQGADSWCNPPGRALGVPATTATSGAHADAYLWVKRVGESDGQCGRGEPPAGAWWPSYAVGLAQRAP